MENLPQEMEEVVGTRFLGSNLSVNVKKADGTETRWAEGLKGTWDTSDQIGLGWVPYKNAETDQEVGKAPGTKLYANHSFDWNEDAGMFTSHGNFYQGWHFAYYPWEHMIKVGEKIFTVNPAQTKCEEGKNPRYLRTSQALFISHRQFITPEMITKDNTIDAKFAVQATANMISVNTAPASGSAFVSDADLAKNLKAAGVEIKTMEITMGDNVFAEQLKLTPKNLPVYDNTKSETENAEILTASLYKPTNGALTPVGSYQSTISTDVSAADYYVDDNTQLKAIVVPNAIELNWEDDAAVKAALDAVSIKITLTNDSYFEIGYVENAEEGTPAYKNNEAIEKLLKAYTKVNAEDWSATKVLGVFNRANNTQVNLNVQLYGDIFNTDATFNNINSLDAWKAAVDMANWLKREEQTFTLTGNVEFEGGVIPMPANGCKVIANYSEDSKRFNQKFYLTPGEGATGNVEYNEWPEKLESHVYVEVAEGVAFNAAHLMNDKTVQIVNNGIINIPEGTAEAINTVSTGAYALVNKEKGVVNVAPYGQIGDLQNTGRVIVEYGAFVYPRSGEEGVIAYVVTNGDIDNPSRIVKLTTKTATSDQKNLASVNTLIVNSDLKEVLDLTKKTVTPGAGSDNDPYAPSAPGSESSTVTNFGDLATVDFEINGGKIASSTDEVSINNVKMNGGGINGLVKINGNLNATNKATVAVKTINGSVTTDGDVTATEVIGEMNVNGSTINVEKLGTVTAQNSIIFANEITGNVTATGCTINAAAITGTVTATDCKINGAAIKGNVTAENGKTTFKNVKIDGTLSIESGATAEVDSENVIYITNIINTSGTLISNNDIIVNDVTLQNKSVTTLGKNWDKTIWYNGTYVHNNSQLNGYVKKRPASTAELQEVLNGAVAGATIALSDKTTDYGTITLGELKDVTIEGNNTSKVIFLTNADSKLENVKIKSVGFEYTGATVNCGIVINAEAQIDNLVVENCTFVGTGAKAGRGIYGDNNSASIELKGCTFKDLGYPIYAWGGYESLTVEGCIFENIQSWAIMPQSGFDGDLTVTACNFVDCKGGGLVKAGTLTAGHTFTFTNNIITGCTIAGDHNWFQFNTSAGTKVISGNKKDGSDWTPGVAEGLK